MKFEDLSGQKFNHLTVLERYGTDWPTIWKCQCDCGNITYVRSGNLKSGEVKSCGCLKHIEPLNKTHGMSHSKLYCKWNSMRRRCNEETHQAYQYYGGKGIHICDEWNNSFEAFRDWAYETGYKEESKLSIDRIDSNGDYSPDNCRWATNKVQANNTSSNIMFEHDGRTQNLTQ